MIPLGYRLTRRKSSALYITKTIIGRRYSLFQYKKEMTKIPRPVVVGPTMREAIHTTSLPGVIVTSNTTMKMTT